MNVDCTSTDQCAKAGMTLYNTSSQTRLTDSLARSGISLLPGTFQVRMKGTAARVQGSCTLMLVCLGSDATRPTCIRGWVAELAVVPVLGKVVGCLLLLHHNPVCLSCCIVARQRL